MITGQVLIHEYISAHRLHRKKMAQMTGATGLILSIMGVIVLSIASRRWGIMLIGAGLGGLIGECIQQRLFLPTKLRKLYLQIRNRTNVTYSWNDEKIFLSSEHGNVERPWGDFTKAKENQDVILLYYNDALFEILAKRWFQDPGQIADFRRHLKLVK